MRKKAQGVFDGQVISMMQQLHVRKNMIRKGLQLDSHDISIAFSSQVRDKLLRMTPAKRGEIADLADSSCVPCCQPVDDFDGRRIIVEIALRLVLERMLELLQEEQSRREHNSVQDQHDVTGRGSIGHAVVRKVSPPMRMETFSTTTSTGFRWAPRV